MLIGILASLPVTPSCPQVVTSAPPRLWVLEKMASTLSRERLLIGLSLLTNTARESSATPILVGLKPCFFSNSSISELFISRDMGPSWAVPAIRAGGAVLEPLPSIWMLTLGYFFLKPSAQ